MRLGKPVSGRGGSWTGRGSSRATESHGEPRKVTGQGPRARSSGRRAETCSYIVEHRAFSQILSVSPGMGEGDRAEGAREP